MVDPELSDGRCDDIVRLLIDRDIPIIVHSGVGKTELSETDFAAGKFFGKPSQTELLADTVFQLSGST